VAGFGGAESGRVIAADGSTEHFGVPCCSLRRVDEAGPGNAWCGPVVLGQAG
jgi:hypothetical protein